MLINIPWLVPKLIWAHFLADTQVDLIQDLLLSEWSIMIMLQVMFDGTVQHLDQYFQRIQNIWRSYENLFHILNRLSIFSTQGTKSRSKFSVETVSNFWYSGITLWLQLKDAKMIFVAGECHFQLLLDGTQMQLVTFAWHQIDGIVLSRGLDGDEISKHSN